MSYPLRQDIVAAALERHYALQHGDAKAVDVADRRIASAAGKLAASLPASFRPRQKTATG